MVRLFRPQRLFPFIAALALAVLSYWPGLNGDLLLDDWYVILNNPFIRLDHFGFDGYTLARAADSFTAGGRQLSMLSFALNHYFFGDSTWWLKFVNLIVHGLNGVLLYLLLSLLLRYRRRADITKAIEFVPLLAACLWLVHPLNLTAVLYISQRMTLLAAFFILSGLVFYAVARQHITTPIRKAVYLPLGLAAFTIFGFKCKETAILLPLYAFAVEWCLFAFKDRDAKTDRVVVMLFAIGAVLALGLIIGQFIVHPDWLINSYSYRYFDLRERVLTQFRALVYYLYQTVMPSNRELSLWHDDFALSRSFIAPITTLYSFLALIGLALVGLIAVKRAPLVGFGILWFFISHSLESTILNLEIMHEHRNYLATFGIMVALVGLLLRATTQKWVVFACIAVMFTAYWSVLRERAVIWGDGWAHALHEAQQHPHSPAALFRVGRRYYEEALAGDSDAGDKAVLWLSRAMENDPYKILSELSLITASDRINTRYDPNWLRRAARKLQQYPYMASSKGAMKYYFFCLRAQNCNRDREGIDHLFHIAEQAADNQLKAIAAMYFTHIKSDFTRAERIFRAVRGRGLALDWVNYIQFLLFAERPAEACTEFRDFEARMKQHHFPDILAQGDQITLLTERFKDCEEGVPENRGLRTEDR